MTYSTAVRMAVLAVVFGTFAGCERPELEAGAHSSSSGGGAQELERRWLGELSLESSIGDTPPVVLGLPALLTAGPDGGFALADFGDHSVRAFDREGQERWAFGQEGQGPGEFVRFGGLTFNADGSIAVLDPELQRVTLIDEHGKLVSTTPLPNPARKLLPVRVSEAGWVVMPRDNEHLWVEVSREGQRRATMILPPELHVEEALIREPFTSRSTMGAIVAYRWSSLLVFLDKEGTVRGITDGVENLEFPTPWSDMPGVIRVDPEATSAARDVSAALGKVFVLFTGAEVVDSRVVDIYDEESMSYVGSYRVPRTVMNIAALADGRLATLERDLVPTVRIWSLGGRSSADAGPSGR